MCPRAYHTQSIIHHHMHPPIMQHLTDHWLNTDWPLYALFERHHSTSISNNRNDSSIDNRSMLTRADTDKRSYRHRSRTERGYDTEMRGTRWHPARNHALSTRGHRDSSTGWRGSHRWHHCDSSPLHTRLCRPHSAVHGNQGGRRTNSRRHGPHTERRWGMAETSSHCGQLHTKHLQSY